MLNSIHINSLFQEAIFRPLISEITKKRTVIVLIATAIFTTLSLSLVYYRTSCFKHRSIKQIPENQPLEEDNSPKNSSLRKIKEQNPLRHQQLDEIEKDVELEQEPLQNPFQSMRVKFVGWLTQSAKGYPTQYRTGSIDLIVERFDSSSNKREFFKGIDHLKDTREITGPSAYHIKNEFEKLFSQSDIPLIPKEQIDQLDSHQDPLDISKLGMTLEDSYPSFPVINDTTRFGVRDLIIADICNLFGIDPLHFPKQISNVGHSLQDPRFQTYFQKITLFTPQTDQSKYMTQSKTQILGRFEVLVIPCTMDYNAYWKKSQPQTEFSVCHGAALNIGETAHAEDYKDYSLKDGSLNKKKYLEDMGKIFHQMLSAQQASGAEHAVWFPFGMGAFLRNLPKLDPSYQDRQALADLRQQIAHAFVSEVCKFPNLQIYMCLPLDDQIGSDTQQNYNAFVHAFSKVPQINQQVKFFVNVDATDLAQNLANKYKAPYKVSLANGANRNLIGNHWFKGRCRTAINENLHRRSFRAALIALVLNNGIETTKRQADELSNRVVQFGGKHLTI